MAADCLIWSRKHGGAWYRPECKGYTINPDIAGKFQEAEANEMARISRGELLVFKEHASFVTRKRNEYVNKKRREIRACLETMTPQQVASVMGELIAERVDLLVRGLI